MPVLVAITVRLSPWALGLEQPGVLNLLGRVADRAADVAAALLGDGAGVGGAFDGEGAFHLGEQGERQERDLARAAGVGGVDPDRVCQRPHTDLQLVHEVQDLTKVPAEPVEGVDHDRVARPGVRARSAVRPSRSTVAPVFLSRAGRGPGPARGSQRRGPSLRGQSSKIWDTHTLMLFG